MKLWLNGHVYAHGRGYRIAECMASHYSNSNHIQSSHGIEGPLYAVTASCYRELFDKAPPFTTNKSEGCLCKWQCQANLDKEGSRFLFRVLLALVQNSTKQAATLF